MATDPMPDRRLIATPFRVNPERTKMTNSKIVCHWCGNISPHHHLLDGACPRFMEAVRLLAERDAIKADLDSATALLERTRETVEVHGLFPLLLSAIKGFIGRPPRAEVGI